MPQWLQWSLIIAGLVAIILLAVFIRRQMQLLSENRKRQAKVIEYQHMLYGPLSDTPDSAARKETQDLYLIEASFWFIHF